MKKLLLAAVSLVVLLAAIVIIRTLMFTPPEHEATNTITHAPDADVLAGHLAEAIQFPTISRQDPDAGDVAAFDGFIAWFEATYPAAHTAMNRTLIADHTILLEWRGRDTSARPVLLTAHYDVVPVIPGTEDQWEQPPYAGIIADGYVWGRGALDDKGAIIAMMEAATMLLERGFQPQQTVYFSFGHDEEIGGRVGAASVVEYLRERDIQLAWSLDEGSFVLDGLIPGLDKPVAMINVAEKGYVTIDIVASATGGHSSMPPGDTAVTTLAAALVKLRDAPVPGGLDGVSGEAYSSLARHMPFTQRMAFANQWLFGGMIEGMLTRLPAGNAMLRTTTAPTMLSASIKENVLPITATATVNFRLHPRDTVDSVVAHVENAIGADNIEVIARRGNNASPVASTTSAGFEAMVAATHAVFGEVAIAPGLTVAGTDSKHYALVADDAYRFHPFVLGPDDITTIHGTNEKVSIANLVYATDFYIELLSSLERYTAP
ncbi:M20 family peptidase [Pyruvatibacter sp.]|uniref:M20 family peptidase n=1 Tax=Pyruvatibacter sp. TaxID=1981328 RepID=UPI0032EC69BF